MFGGGSSQPAITPVTAAPRKTDQEVQDEKAKERARLRNRQGRGSTLLTRGGITGDTTISGDPAVAKPTLLGGGTS